MEASGTVKGDAARKYPRFTYRLPVPLRIDIRQLDPERLHSAHMYPRQVNPPSQPNVRLVELADYSVRVSTVGSDGKRQVQVWMQPNQYTDAKAPWLAFEFSVYSGIHRCDCIDEALSRVFGDHAPGNEQRNDL